MAPQKKKAAPVGESKLTDKQQRFVEEYCKDFNKTQAALRAGYSENTAYNIGWENVKKREIREAIDKRLKVLSLSADETLKGISDIAKSNLNDYFKIRKVPHTPKVKKPLQTIISEIRAKIEDASKLIARSKIVTDERREKHSEWVAHQEDGILALEIELERNPDAYRIESGDPQLVEVAELDLAKLIKDKEAGRIKSVKPTEFGLSVEMYAADAALTNLARIHGLFEKDNKQQQGKVTVKLGGKSVG